MNSWIKQILIWYWNNRNCYLANILKPIIQGATLDVGCGNGDVTKKLDHDNIIGIDIYEPPRPRIPVKLFNGTQIPFADKTFDTILCIFMLHHVENLDPLVEEMKRVGKKIVVFEDAYDNILHKMSVLLLHAIALKLLKIPYRVEGFKSRDSWHSFFTEQGFKVVSCTRYPSCEPIFPFLEHYLFVLEAQ